MKITIIVPIYNVEPYLDECVQSAVGQTYKDLEIILVNDGSTDNCQVICESYAYKDSRIRIVNQDNGGLSAARNSGLKLANGEYVFFLDADDKLFPHSITSLTALVAKYPGVDIVQGNIEPQTDCMRHLHFKEASFGEFSTDTRAIRKNILHNVLPITAWNKLIRKDFLLKNNIYFKEGLLHEDELWSWNYQKHIKSMAVCSKNTYWYRTDNQTSITANKDLTRSFVNLLEIYKHIATSAYDDMEQTYAFHFCGPYFKMKRWKYVKDKRLVIEKLKEVIEYLHAHKPVNKALLYKLYTWYLPHWLIGNNVCAKINAEWGKRI